MNVIQLSEVRPSMCLCIAPSSTFPVTWRHGTKRFVVVVDVDDVDAARIVVQGVWPSWAVSTDDPERLRLELMARTGVSEVEISR